MDATLLDAEAEAAVLRVYRQVFAVLAREAGAMIVDPDLLDVDQAILDAFAEAGSDGLTVEQATLACRGYQHDVIVRRFEVLRQYGAITKLVDRPNELRHPPGCVRAVRDVDVPEADVGARRPGRAAPTAHTRGA
jgi:hypothetical protein